MIFTGALLEATFVWNLSDVIMGVMALVNIPVCIVLGHKAFDALKDYAAQLREGKNPVYRPEKLYLDTADAELMKGKKILIVDDVISTGESLHAVEQLVLQTGAEICGRMAILAEGDAQKRDDIIYLEKLPLFTPAGEPIETL